MATNSELPSLQVLICTYNEGIAGIPQLLLPARRGVSYLVSHQYSEPLSISAQHVADALEGRHDVTLVRHQGKGLSRNRNTALENATAELLLIADDDAHFSDNAFDDIRRAMAGQPDAIAATFRISTPEGTPYKRYPERTRHTRRSIFRISSIELVLRREALLAHGIRFDERFGLNARFPCCEEIVLSHDLLASGCLFPMFPMVIAYHSAASSGRNYQSVASCRARGALLARTLGWRGYLAMLLFGLRHRHEFTDDRTLFSFLKDAHSGFVEVFAHHEPDT